MAAMLDEHIDKTVEKVWRRGTKFEEDPEKYNQYILKKIREHRIFKDIPESRILKFGNLYLHPEAENEHGLIIGAPGRGKSVLTYQIVEQVKAIIEKEDNRKNKGIVYDMKGDYIAYFYNPERDKIFNPVDERTVKWNFVKEVAMLKTEVARDAAINSIAVSLIPDANDGNANDKFFKDAARDVFKGLFKYLLYCMPKEYHHNAGLVSLLQCNTDYVRKMLNEIDPAAANYLGTTDSGQSAGVMAVLTQFTSGLRLIAYEDGDFFLEDWVNNGKGFIFLANCVDVRDLIRPVLTLFLDQVGKALLAKPEELDFRLFMLIDEFPTLQKMSILVELLTLARSKGGAVWLVTQDLGNIENVYGKNHKSAIYNSAGTKVIFSVTSPEDADYIANTIGNIEWYIRTQQVSGNIDSIHVSKTERNYSYSTSIQSYQAVLPSTIMQLEKFHFVLKSGYFPVTVGKVQYVPRQAKHKTIVQRESFPKIPDSIRSYLDKKYGGTSIETNTQNIGTTPYQSDMSSDMEIRRMAEDSFNDFLSADLKKHANTMEPIFNLRDYILGLPENTKVEQNTIPDSMVKLGSVIVDFDISEVQAALDEKLRNIVNEADLEAFSRLLAKETEESTSENENSESSE